MIEVHAPDQTPHSWRDFFIHIATIVVGLLIAVMLEQGVEWLHHRHQLHLAEHNLQVEFEENRKTLADDERHIATQSQRLVDMLNAIDAIRQHKPFQKVATGWAWNGLSSAAWDTARNNGTTAFMPYERAQAASDLYNQQEEVNTQALVYLNDIYRMIAPLQGRKTPDQLTPAQLDRLELDTELALADTAHLSDLCRSLDEMSRGYESNLK